MIATLKMKFWNNQSHPFPNVHEAKENRSFGIGPHYLQTLLLCSPRGLLCVPQESLQMAANIWQ
jgi:uncharacterized membrane protein SirB2